MISISTAYTAGSNYTEINFIDADVDVGTNATIISGYYSFQFYIFNDL